MFCNQILSFVVSLNLFNIFDKISLLTVFSNDNFLILSRISVALKVAILSSRNEIPSSVVGRFTTTFKVHLPSISIYVIDL